MSSVRGRSRRVAVLSDVHGNVVALRAVLSDLDAHRLMLGKTTLVVHGSPRHVCDAVLASTPEHELEAMFAGESARLAFLGHTHCPLIRAVAQRRLVNVGSVGLPLDGNPRAAYAVAVHSGDDQTDDWEVSVRRVPFDVEAAIAAYRNGLAQAAPWFAEIMARQLRTAHNYFGPWLRVSKHLSAHELPAALRRYLAANP